MLLERAAVPAGEAVRRLVGLQAQVQNPPYFGLWTRLRDFHREDLTGAMEERRIVRAALMRSTLHLMAAEDYLLFWPALQPALARALRSFFGKRAKGLEIEWLVSTTTSSSPTPTARVLPDEHRKKVLLSAGRVRATVLIDGFVSGTWRIERGKGTAVLVVEPFGPLSTGQRDVLAAEGEGLLHFAANGAENLEVRFAEA
jgi:hypothetical protein